MKPKPEKYSSAFSNEASRVAAAFRTELWMNTLDGNIFLQEIQRRIQDN